MGIWASFRLKEGGANILFGGLSPCLATSLRPWTWGEGIFVTQNILLLGPKYYFPFVEIPFVLIFF